MKLPKDFPIKLTYVLLIILIWNYMISPSQKEQFDMKTMKNIQIKLRNNEDEEEFNIETFEDIKRLLTKKMEKLKSKINLNKDDDKEETFEVSNVEDLYNKSSSSSSLHSSPFN